MQFDEHCFRYTLCWYGSSRVWTRRYVRLYNVDVKTACSKCTLYGHVFSVVWRMSGLPYGYFRETHWISMGLREINMVTLVNMHGPIWQTFETISARNPCRLFQKFISAARHGRPSTACSHGPLWRTSATIGARNLCRLFQKSIPAARHGQPSTARPHGPLWWTFATIGVRNPRRLFQKSIPAARHDRPSTARSDWLLKQSAQGSRAICFKSPSQRPVTTGRPRPALTEFWNNRRQESVPFVSKVHPGGPSRLSVHGPTPRPALVDFCNNRREESVPFVSKVHPSRPSRTSVHGRLPRPALTDFWNNRRQESVPFVPALTDFWNNRRQESVPFVPALTDFWNNQRQESVPFVPALTDFWNNRRQEFVPFVSKVPPGGPSRPVWRSQPSPVLGMPPLVTAHARY